MRSRISTFELPRVFRGTDALSAGVLSAAQLRGPSTRRVLRGVYTLAGVPDSHELRCEAAGLVLRAGAQITGTSMATVLGVPLARTADAVPRSACPCSAISTVFNMYSRTSSL